MQAPVPLHSPPCPVCGGEAYSPVLDGVEDLIWRKEGRFQLQACGGCGLVATRPRPTFEGLGYYYEGAYSGGGDEDLHSFERGDGLGGLVMRYRLAVLQKVRPLTADDHLLDVGCNRAGFLRVARESTGCRTSGIDLDQGSVDNAVQPELCDLRVGLLTEADYPPASFSAVTFLESLEHHDEPVAALARARELLVDGGVCLVEVPNFGGFWRRIFGRFWMPLLVPQHLFHYTPETLRKAFEAAGFTDIAHQQTMFYPLEGVASLGLWLGRVLRMPPPGSKPSWRTPFDLLVVLNLVVLYFTVEIPSQLVLRLLGLAGHQVLVARK